MDEEFVGIMSWTAIGKSKWNLIKDPPRRGQSLYKGHNVAGSNVSFIQTSFRIHPLYGVDLTIALGTVERGVVGGVVEAAVPTVRTEGVHAMERVCCRDGPVPTPPALQQVASSQDAHREPCKQAQEQSPITRCQLQHRKKISHIYSLH